MKHPCIYPEQAKVLFEYDKNMAINILSLNSAIFKKLAEEDKQNTNKLYLINQALLQQGLNPDTVTALTKAKHKIEESQKTDRVVFFTRTHKLVEEYTNIIKNPLSRTEDNKVILTKKTNLANKFLSVLRQLVKIKGWHDLNVPVVLTTPTINRTQTNYKKNTSDLQPTVLDNNTQVTHVTHVSAITHANTCDVCNNSENDMFEVDEYNRRTCLICSTQKERSEIGITYKDYARVNIVSRFIYNRVLHFNDCIKQYQGKQNCKIPENVFNDLDKKFAAFRLFVCDDTNTSTKEDALLRISDGSESNKSIAPPSYVVCFGRRPDPVRYSKITRAHIMMFLKDLKYTKHYENANLIYTNLTNKRVDDITHLEDKLVQDFKELIALYDEIYGKDKKEEIDRKNFLNSSYLLFQLLRRHGHPCKIENFPILKTVDRKLFHDTICKNLFFKLNWKFTPIF